MKTCTRLLLLSALACSSAEFGSNSLEEDSGSATEESLNVQGMRGRIITRSADLPAGWRAIALPESTVVEFTANPTEDRLKTIHWGHKKQRESIKLATRRTQLGTERIVQLDKIPRYAEVRQTHSNQTAVTKTFDTRKAGILDILMVVDNSRDKSGTVLGVDLNKKNIDHSKLADKLGQLLSGSGVLSGIDWQLVLATSEHYVANTTPLTRGRYLPGQVAEFKRSIKVFADDTRNFPAWQTQREKVIWKARQVLGDIDQSGAWAWKGSNRQGNSTQQVQNFFPYSVWRGGKWVKASGYEQGHSWLRENSSLAVIVISDEDFQCNRAPQSHFGLAPDTRIAGKYPWDSFYCGMKDHIVKEMNWHRPPRGGKDMWRLYGIFDTKTTCKDLNFNAPNTKYFKQHVWEHAYNNSTAALMNPCFDCRALSGNKCDVLAQRVFNANHKPFAANFLKNRRFFSEIFYLYDGNYALRKIASDVQAILQHDFRLDHHADVINNLAIRLDNVALNRSRYELDGQVIKLSEGVLTGSSRQLSVSYNIDSSAANQWVREVSLAERKLNSASSISDVAVRLRKDSDGTVMALPRGSVWEYEQSSEKIKFNNKTAAGTLLISWQENPAKKIAFTIKNKSVRITSIVDVIIGERTLTTGFSFNAGNRTLTFDSNNDVPDYGKTGTVRYHYTTGKRTSYVFSAGDDLEGRVRCRLSCGNDLIENRELACTYNAESSRIVLNRESELANIENFEVCYAVSDATPAAVALPANMLEDSVELSIDGAIVCRGGQLIVADNTLSLSEANDCDAVAGLQNSRSVEVGVHYTVVNSAEQFILPEPSIALVRYNSEYWEVYVNDELTEDYSRDSRTISFNGLPPESKVRVVIHLLP